MKSTFKILSALEAGAALGLVHILDVKFFKLEFSIALDIEVPGFLVNHAVDSINRICPHVLLVLHAVDVIDYTVVPFQNLVFLVLDVSTY